LADAETAAAEGKRRTYTVSVVSSSQRKVDEPNQHNYRNVRLLSAVVVPRAAYTPFSI